MPQPPGLPLIGNLADIDQEMPIKTFEQFADIYGECCSANLWGKGGIAQLILILTGPIYRFNSAGTTKVIITSVELMDEFCDEKRFVKVVRGALNEVRAAVGDGLFTAHDGEKNWGIAHRVLMPAFGPLSIEGMFDGDYPLTRIVA